MISSFPALIYSGMIVFHILAAAAHLLGKRIAEKAFFSAGFIVSLFGVAGIVISESRPPLFGPFESVLTLVVCLALFSLITGRTLSPRSRNVIDRAVTATILTLLAIQATKPVELNSDFYMYDNFWVNAFFLFRLISTALFIYAGLLLWVGASVRDLSSGLKSTPLHLGRNFLLSGIAAFLCAEWAGSYWCLNWLGDTWQWSRGFFRGSGVFLLVMIACHLPPFMTRHRWSRPALGSLPGLFCLWMIFFH